MYAITWRRFDQAVVSHTVCGESGMLELFDMLKKEKNIEWVKMINVATGRIFAMYEARFDEEKHALPNE